jgi:hypothetical protein
VFTEALLRNGFHNSVVPPLLGADDIGNTASSIVECWTVRMFTVVPLLLCNLATDCLPRICLHGNLFTNLLPSNGCTCHNINGFMISELTLARLPSYPLTRKLSKLCVMCTDTVVILLPTVLESEQLAVS